MCCFVKGEEEGEDGQASAFFVVDILRQTMRMGIEADTDIEI